MTKIGKHLRLPEKSGTNGARPDDVPPVTRPQLARCLGADRNTVAKWEQYEGLPVLAKGRGGHASLYDIPTVLAWQRDRERKARAGSNGVLDEKAERAMLDQKRREEIDLRLQVKRGDLVLRDDVVLAGRNLVEAAKARLLALGHQLVQGGVIPREREATVNQAVREALTELSRLGAE